jgi:WS/DGAT/MGAT family acyltransferase
MNKPLTLIDLAFLLLESRVQTGHVGGLVLFALPDNAGEGFFQRAVESHQDWRRANGVFRLKLQRTGIKLGWVADDTTDAATHIQYLVLPRPGNRQRLYALVERLHAQPLDRHHPLWEVAFIDRLEGGRGALYIKIHHALVDGISAIRTLLQSFSTSPDIPPHLFWQTELPSAQPGSADDQPSFLARLEKFQSSLRSTAAVAPVFAQETVRPLLHAIGLDQEAGLSSFMAPRSMLNRQITSRRQFASHEFSLQKMTTVAKAAGVTLNDVVLMVCASALRRYLAEHDALPRAPLVTWMPISIRSKEDQRPSNQVTIACVSLATNIADPLQRFRAIQTSTTAAKQEVVARSREATEWATLLRGGWPILTDLLGVSNLLPPAANLTISNVPGITKDFYFHEAKLEGIYPLSALVGTMGLNITLVSCGDTLAVGLLACPDTIPALDTLASYLGDAFNEFQQLFSSQQSATATPVKSKRRKRRV